MRKEEIALEALMDKGVRGSFSKDVAHMLDLFRVGKELHETHWHGNLHIKRYGGEDVVDVGKVLAGDSRCVAHLDRVEVVSKLLAIAVLQESRAALTRCADDEDVLLWQLGLPAFEGEGECQREIAYLLVRRR